MEKQSLKEIFEQINAPELTDELLQVIQNNVFSPYFYNCIQRINALDKSVSNQISDADQAKITKSLGSVYHKQSTFDHYKSKDYVAETNNRLYINCPKQNIADIIITFAEKCKEQGLPYYFKHCTDNESVNARRADQIVIYSNIIDTADYVQILREMAQENPQLVQSCGNPPVLTGNIDGWIGFGDEPLRSQKKELGKKDVSYSSFRTAIITELMTNRFIEDPEELRQAILSEYEKYGLSAENPCVGTAMTRAYKDEDGIMQKFEESYDRQVKSSKSRSNLQKERDMLSVIEILEKHEGISPELRLAIDSMLGIRKNYLSDLTKESASMTKENLEFEDLPENVILFTSSNEIQIGEQRALAWGVGAENRLDELDPDVKKDTMQILQNGVINHFKNNVLEDIQIIEELKARYQELDALDFSGNLDLGKEHADLYSRIQMVSRSKEFLIQVGVDEQTIGDVCEQTQEYLDEMSKLDPEVGNEIAERTGKELLETIVEELSQYSTFEFTPDVVKELIKETGIGFDDVNATIEKIAEQTKALREGQQVNIDGTEQENKKQDDEPSL